MTITKKAAYLFVLSLLVFTVGCKGKPASPATLLLDEMITAYGGEGALKTLNSYSSFWDMRVQVRAEEGEAVVHVEQPNNLRVELIYPQRSEVRILRGNKAFKQYDDAPPRPVTGPQLDAMKLQLMRLYTPLTLKGFSKKGLITLGEDRGYKTLTLVKDGLTAVYYVNQGNLMIENVIGTLNMNGREMQFMTIYSAFKKIDGVAMHQNENKYAGGVNTAILYLKELRVDQSHPSSFWK